MSLWGPLAERYDTVRPRKLLALDGGGIRGVMTLEILAEIERQLRDLTGGDESFRLCDFFDYIGGTSTGAIIATGLARGMSAEALLDFYQEVGPAMFQKQSFLKRLLSGMYQRQPLADALQGTFGAKTTLFPEHLRCLLLAVTRNRTTDSPWPISSNPLAQFNDPKAPDCNLKIPLWKLVRASTAAPIFFEPEVIQLDPGNPASRYVFVDGGITPYNNPAFLLYRMATLPQYRLGWETGEDRLMLVSVGTGAAATVDQNMSGKGNALTNLAGLPGALMYGILMEQDTNCRTVGRCVHGAPIDYELGDMIPRDADDVPVPISQDLGRAFLYARYNADLTREGLDGLGLDDLDPARVQRLDSIEDIPDLRRVGRAVARAVRMTDFAPFLP